MFWNEDTVQKDNFVVPDEIVDFHYKLDCKSLPLDHAWPLSHALQQALPWLRDEKHAGVHLIHVAESGNGWYRPDDPETDLLFLSKRTRMTIRIPKTRLPDAQQLSGTALDIAGHRLTVKDGSPKLLSALPTLFARYVQCDSTHDELGFLQSMATQLRALGIPVNKLMAGKQHHLKMPDKTITTRSLMVADLTPELSVHLQQIGLGPGRIYGCGLFIPQKGIKPVKSDGE